jgi:(R,R)-butanediol dehydrogenase/meso-butanediol dehydrogenase/diacetyl reductase
VSDVPALIWDGVDNVAVRDVPAPVAREGWVLVDVDYVGVCGTDLHVMRGEHPRAQAGIVLGHEFVGTLSDDHPTLARGTKVFINPLVYCGRCQPCRRGNAINCEALVSLGLDFPGAMCAQVAVPAGSLFPLPDDIDLPSAALLEPLAICVRAIRRSGLKLGDRVQIIGAGPIGSILAILARAAGAGVVSVAEPSLDRRARIAALGFSVDATAQDELKADVVFDATGHDAVAPTLDSWVTAGGTMVIVGAYAPHPQSVNVSQFMYRELTMLGTKTYNVAEIGAAISLLSSKSIDVTPLITSIHPLRDGVAAFAALARGEGMKVLVQPGRVS